MRIQESLILHKITNMLPGLTNFKPLKEKYSQGGDYEDHSLLECDAVKSGRRLPTFLRFAVPFFRVLYAL
jgi:hypothetical protein